MGLSYKAFPLCPFPAEKPRLLMIVQSPPTPPPAGERVFKYLSLGVNSTSKALLDPHIISFANVQGKTFLS